METSYNNLISLNSILLRWGSGPLKSADLIWQLHPPMTTEPLPFVTKSCELLTALRVTQIQELFMPRGHPLSSYADFTAFLEPLPPLVRKFTQPRFLSSHTDEGGSYMPKNGNGKGKSSNTCDPARGPIRRMKCQNFIMVCPSRWPHRNVSEMESFNSCHLCCPQIRLMGVNFLWWWPRW